MPHPKSTNTGSDAQTGRTHHGADSADFGPRRRPYSPPRVLSARTFGSGRRSLYGCWNWRLWKDYAASGWLRDFGILSMGLSPRSGPAWGRHSLSFKLPIGNLWFRGLSTEQWDTMSRNYSEFVEQKSLIARTKVLNVAPTDSVVHRSCRPKRLQGMANTRLSKSEVRTRSRSPASTSSENRIGFECGFLLARGCAGA